jgi:predicted 3-demethylubiquinone-9 3-methyltransferase (glyoxalase superfamily)
MSKITPCLWFNYNGEEAAKFYTGLFADSRIDNLVKAPSDTPSNRKGDVLVVEFTLAGEKFIGLNGGPHFTFNEAVSFQIRTKDQAETDRLTAALIADGGEQGPCGWVKDRFGLSWQVTPERMLELMSDPDPERARRATEAMLKMHRIDIAEVERAAAAETVEA